MKKINRIKTEDNIEIPTHMYSVHTAHECKAKNNKEVIFSTYFNPDFKCPFCNEIVLELQ